jgi:beta-galactosidase
MRLTRAAGLFDLVAHVTPVQSAQPLSFEDMDQSGGYVLYRHRFTSAVRGTLDVSGLRDYGEVFVNGSRVATLDRRTNVFATSVAIPAGGRLDILVENMGRINYGAELVHNRKGIIEPVTLNGKRVAGWSMYRLPFDTPLHVRGSTTDAAGVPALYRGTFTLERTGDTFLDMRGWSRGIVFVNGVNLGRYWNVGPQQTLYLPGAWLRRGANDIEVFDLNGHVASPMIAGLIAPVLDQLAPTS